MRLKKIGLKVLRFRNEDIQNQIYTIQEYIELLIDDNMVDVGKLMVDIVNYFSGVCDIFSFWKINERVKDISLLILFILSIISIVVSSYNPFIYFRF